MIVSASILTADFSNLESEIKKVEPFIEWLHLDVMDGYFVPNISMGAAIITSARKVTSLFFDVHLMVQNPYNHIDAFIESGAESITFHIEADCDVDRTIDKIKKANIKAGIVLSPDTPVDSVYRYLDKIDMVLVMSVYPGYGGQAFITNAIPKIEALAKKRKEKNLNFLIEVDGGINPSTAKMCKEAGCNVLVTGSYLYNSTDIKATVDSLK